MKKTINVTFVINNLSGGGAERVLVNLLNSLDREKFKPKLFLFEYEGKFLKDLDEDIEVSYGIKFTEESSKFKHIFRSYYKYIYRSILGIRKLEDFIKEDEMVIAFLEKMVTYNVARTKKNKDMVCIAWLHNNIYEFSNIHKYLSRKYYQKYNNIFCVSNECTDLAREYFSNSNINFETVYNPIYIETIVESSKKESNFKMPKGKNILAIGRLTRQKGFDILIEAFSKVNKDDVNLIILGEGEERRNLEELVKKLKLKSKVYLPGFVDNPYSILRQSDLFVLSSRFEGLPTVLIEALTLNKTIVSTKCSGSREILENGKYGYLVEKNDVADLYDKISIALNNLDEFNNGYERAKDFDKDKIIKEIEDKLTTIYFNRNR